jgi:hypothetical protein
MKVLSSYDEVDLYWLLNGKGTFPKKNTTEVPENTSSTAKTPIKNIEVDTNEIDRIIIFYKDGSFKNFQN